MKITELKGIGEKYAQLLGRLSVYTVEDLVGLYPRDYELYQEPAFISTLSPDYENNNVVIDGVVSKKIDVYHTGKLAVISTFINDENGDRIKCTWFNMPFLKSSLKLGMRYIFRGRFVIKNGIKIAINTGFFQIKIGYTINISNKSQTAAASKIQAVPFLLDCNLPFLS